MTTTREKARIAAATHEVRRAVADIIRRGGPADLMAGEIHQAYTGRGWTPPPPPVRRCPEHPGVDEPCPICRALA